MMRFLTSFVLSAAVLLPGVLRAAEGADPNSPRVAGLLIAPARLDAATTGTLLPRAEELTEGNAATLYSKAIKALPKNLDMYPVWGWLRLPLRDLPREQAQAVMTRVKTTLDLLHQGARCKSCKWPRFTPEATASREAEYRHLTCLLCIKARLEIADGQFDKALDTIRTGLGVSKHVGEAPSIMQGRIGIAMASVSLMPLEDLVQTRNAPNLAQTIHTTPRALVDLEKAIASDEMSQAARSVVGQEVEQLYAKLRASVKQLDANLAALECIEALRHFAAGHEGQLPAQLDLITDVSIPNDPVTGKPFAYRLEGSKAILEPAVPKDGVPLHSTRYEITVVR
ncbi:MAG: hypothetical protein ACM3VT_06585 [Solirubrobacterales bacterium]